MHTTPDTTVPTDRNGLVVLSHHSCMALLATVPLGRVGLMSEGQPLILPVNHLVVEGLVAFRSALGTKLDGAIFGRQVAFEADDYDESRQTGWSVLVRGRLDLVEDPVLLARLDARGPTSWGRHAQRAPWVVVRADHITGRRLASA